MEDENRFKNSNFAEVFGKLEKVHRVRRGCFEKFGIPAVVFGMVLFGVMIYVASEDWLTIPLCVAPFVLMFCGFVWHLFSTRRDELRIYENGFTYKSGKNLQACFWREIKTYRHRERNAFEISELPPGIFVLQSVEKKNGEMIVFDTDVMGTHEIIERFEKR